MKPSLTIGIEEEYQTIDPETRDLRSHIDTEIIAQGKVLLKEAVKSEMHQSVLEVGTGICKNIKDASTEVKALRTEICKLAKKNNLRLAAAGTHSFADCPAHSGAVHQLAVLARNGHRIEVLPLQSLRQVPAH